MSRPKKNIDSAQVEKLASIGCTVEEIAAVVGCAPSTLYDRFSESIKEGHFLRNASLRRMQYSRAMKGSDMMLIWLGKQHLGQKDKQEVSGDPDAPVAVKILGNVKASNL